MEVEETGSYVVIFDIVGFSERSGKEQAKCVDDFLKSLSANLNVLEAQSFNIFPTGDGAIVCIYEKDPSIREDIFDIPLRLARGMLRTNKVNDFDLRISINHSPMERIINVEEFRSIDTNHIQIGNGINSGFTEYHFPGVGTFNVETSQIFS